MRRTYTLERYLTLVERLRDAIPDLAIGTDLIVGFPGETEQDFAATLAAVEQVGFDSAFTFIYSPRQGTEAAAMPDQVPEPVKHERLERLVDVVQRVAAESQRRPCRPVGGGARRGAEPHRLVAPARPHAPQHDGRLRRRRRARRARRRRDRERHVDDAARSRRGARRGLTTGADGAARGAIGTESTRRGVTPVRVSALGSRRGEEAGGPRMTPEDMALPDTEVLAVFGPTASGKSAVAEVLADRLGTEVVSADALQVYRELPILTNQPARPDAPGRHPQHRGDDVGR